MLVPGGKLAILMGDYSDREAGFVPLVYHTKLLAFRAGCGSTAPTSSASARRQQRPEGLPQSSFIPGLHDVCMVFEKNRLTMENFMKQQVDITLKLSLWLDAKMSQDDITTHVRVRSPMHLGRHSPR